MSNGKDRIGEDPFFFVSASSHSLEVGEQDKFYGKKNKKRAHGIHENIVKVRPSEESLLKETKSAEEQKVKEI